MRKCLAAVLMLTVCLFPAMTSFAWNAAGHELVDLIAYQQLTPAARLAVGKLLRQHPRYDKDLLANKPEDVDADLWAFLIAGTWPDVVRSQSHPMMQTENHSVWHYVDYPFNLGTAEGPVPEEVWVPGTDPKNLLQAMTKIQADLNDAAVKDSDKAIRLCWLEHLIGDLHQPLHASALFSDRFPQGDRGGNSQIVQPKNGKPVNLHFYWDSAVTTDATLPAVAKLAAELTADPELSREALKDELSHGAVKDWVMESYAVCKSIVYRDGTLPSSVARASRGAISNGVPPLPEGYEADAAKTARRRIVLAGYRLADQINAIYK